MKNQENKKGPIHLFLWFMGAVFFIEGIFCLFVNFLAAFVLFILSAAYLPPVNDFLYRKLHIELCKRCRVMILLFGIALFFLALERF